MDRDNQKWIRHSKGTDSMYLGHLTVTYAARGALREKLPMLRPLAPLLAGALLPDMLDKPFYWLLDAPGRGMGHAAIPLALGFYIFFRLMPQHRETLAALAAGTLFHLIEDWPHPYVVAWPFLGTWEYFPWLNLKTQLLAFYRGETHPYLLGVEVLSWPFCIYYGIKNRLAVSATPDGLPQQ